MGSDYAEWACNHLWIGDNKNKGLGVFAKPDYIGQMWKYLQEHKAAFAGSDMALIGDFNSNVCWDKWDRWWNHSDVVRELAELDIFSLYHSVKAERQGSEIEPTFYMHRKREKSYHIDYAFVSKKWLPASMLTVGKPDDWLEFSDHMPLIVELSG